MSVKHVAFVMYPVTDLDRAVAFYRDVVGLTPGELTSSAWAEFEVGGTTFGVGNFPQVGVPGTATSLMLEVEDLDAYRAELAKHGIDVPAPFETPICFITGFKDPDGNSIGLHHAKKAT
jgi:predicted enzyme related to lactoylglutathione lyase